MENTEKKRVRRPVNVRLTEKLDKMMPKIDAFTTELKKFNIDTSLLYEVLQNMRENIAAIPPTVKRARKNGAVQSRRPFAVGDTVTIRETARGHYDGLLSDYDMENLKVLAVGRKRVDCETSDNSKVVFPKSHLQLRLEPQEEEEDTPVDRGFYNNSIREVDSSEEELDNSIPF